MNKRERYVAGRVKGELLEGIVSSPSIAQQRPTFVDAIMANTQATNDVCESQSTTESEEDVLLLTTNMNADIAFMNLDCAKIHTRLWCDTYLSPTPTVHGQAHHA